MATNIGIDFGAFREGRRDALEDQQRDLELQSREIKSRSGIADQLTALEEQQQKALAARYLSTLSQNQLKAQQAGIGAGDFLVDQFNQIQNDPWFQSQAPEVQTRIIQQMRDTALLTAQGEEKAGNFAGIDRLLSAFNVPVPVQYGPVGQAIRMGDAEGAVRLLKAQGHQIEYSPTTSTFTLGGVSGIPMPELLNKLNTSTGVAGGLDVAADRGRYGEARDVQKENLDLQTSQFKQNVLIALAELGARGGLTESNRPILEALTKGTDISLDALLKANVAPATTTGLSAPPVNIALGAVQGMGATAPVSQIPPTPTPAAAVIPPEQALLLIDQLRRQYPQLFKTDLNPALRAGRE